MSIIRGELGCAIKESRTSAAVALGLLCVLVCVAAAAPLLLPAGELRRGEERVFSSMFGEGRLEGF